MLMTSTTFLQHCCPGASTDLSPALHGCCLIQLRQSPYTTWQSKVDKLQQSLFPFQHNISVQSNWHISRNIFLEDAFLPSAVTDRCIDLNANSTITPEPTQSTSGEVAKTADQCFKEKEQEMSAVNSKQTSWTGKAKHMSYQHGRRQVPTWRDIQWYIMCQSRSNTHITNIYASRYS